MSDRFDYLVALGFVHDEKDKTFFCKVHPELKYSSIEDCLKHFAESHNPLVPVTAPSPVPVIEKKRGGFREALMGGGDVTSQTIVSNMGKIDDDLPMKTEVKYPMELTLVDLMAVRCEVCGYDKTAKLLRLFAQWYRVNMVSFKRQGRTEAFEAFKALWLEEQRKKEEDMFGRKS